MYAIPSNCECTKRKICPACVIACMCSGCQAQRGTHASSALVNPVVNAVVNGVITQGDK
jgi:hypothetical protein